jgi:predicted GIY-YIG superfamily endonuclease
MGCSVYINQSLKSGLYYIGSSINPTDRLTEHNSGRVKVTKNMKPGF